MLEQSLRSGAAQQGRYAEAACGFSGDGYARGISAEPADVLLYPLEGRNLVEQAADPGLGILFSQIAEVGEPQRAEAIVDRYYDNIAIGAEARTVVPGN